MNRPLIRPARHLSQPLVHAPNAALLIDFDNVTLGIQKDLTKELRTLLNSDIIKGKVAVQRAYADWRRYPQYIVSLSESSIDLIFAPAFGSTKKNATDIRLAIDAIELVFTRPEIGTFILLSGDSDFSTMVIKLKEYGKYVIGVGIRESASDLLIQNCDEYYSYNDLAGLTKEVDPPSIQRDPWELAGQAVAQMARNGDVMRSDRLKQVMQQIDPNFDERNAGFNRFSKFVLEAGQRGVVTVTKLDNGQFEVSPGTAPVVTSPASPAPALPPAPRSRDGAAEPREGREDGGRGRRGRRGG
ncbi:MAG: NYN domain-containing protein, partial [Gemmatimonadales bacterium]|nr:NYN domain-containing protein [Gemmatimonadales bacterium]